MQSVTGPTNEHGHTPDLVLAYGSPVFNLVTRFFDHMPLLFDYLMNLPCNKTKPSFSAQVPVTVLLLYLKYCSSAPWKNVLHFFVVKVNCIRAQIEASSHDPFAFCHILILFTAFNLVIFAGGG